MAGVWTGLVLRLIISIVMIIPSLTLADDNLSRHAPNATREAGEKLLSMERSLEEKRHFQLETRTDLLNFENSNRDLAMWYGRTVARGIFKDLFRETQENYRQNQKRDEREEKRLAQESSSQGSRAPAGQIRAEEPSEAEDEDLQLPGFIQDTAKFVRRLTEDGISMSLPVLSANVRVDTNRPRVETKLASNIFDVSLGYRVDVPNLPDPLPDFETGGELLVLSGSRQFSEVGLSGNVQYQLENSHLLCSLSKQVIGPVIAQVERQWDFTRGEQESSTARLSMSLAF